MEIELKTDREILIAMNTSLNEKLDKIIGDCADHEGRIQKHNERINSLENDRNKLIGAMATVSVAMGVVGGKISAILFGGS
jgi:chromosome segregation ATPase